MDECRHPNGANRPTPQDVALITLLLTVAASTRDEALRTLVLEWLLRGLLFPR